MTATIHDLGEYRLRKTRIAAGLPPCPPPNKADQLWLGELGAIAKNPPIMMQCDKDLADMMSTPQSYEKMTTTQKALLDERLQELILTLSLAVYSEKMTTTQKALLDERLQELILALSLRKKSIKP